MQNWTEDQKTAIEIRNKNLIVSAAAGSGKTAVLIERIFQIISQGEVDISNILMITFTRKAASEMKEKLQKKLDEEISKSRNNNNLKRQRDLLEASDIKTIDSFCLQVVKNNFNELDLDIKFQVLDEKKNTELKTEVLETLMEDEYRKRDPSFIRLVETYGKLESDQALRDNIVDLYDFSQSNPQPEKWLEAGILGYVEDIGQFEDSAVGKYYKEVLLERELKNLKRYLELEDDAVGNGAVEYQELYENEMTQFEEMLLRLNGEGLAALDSCKIEFKTLPRVKKENITEFHEAFKIARNEFKKRTRSLTGNLAQGIKKQSGILAELSYLIELVKKFGILLMEEKRKINLFDYNDIEHFSLQLLSKKEISDKYRSFYKYICIDEYQDTNGVQEKIFNLIAGDSNMFYVGDLKQSIYRFRLADSSIFNDKLNKYDEDENSKALTLNRNFRSSRSVVHGVNSLFDHLMDGFFSPVNYKESARLVHGSSLNNDKRIETYIVNMELGTDLEDDEDSDSDIVKDKVAKEAEICARRIREIVDSGEYEYKDFTILANSIKYIIDPFKEVFDKYGIPVYGEVDTEFLKSMSIGFIIDYLEIIDNLYNDLALINVLKSPIYNFSLEELAIVRKEKTGNEMLIDSLRKYQENELGLLSIKSKISHFIKNIEELKIRINEHNLTDFTIRLLIDSDFYFTIYRKDDYEKESLNIKELLRLIFDFESMNNTHLNGFLKYFRHIQKNELSLPSSSLISEEDNVVRIQTIHKSKGLEYENVFLVKLGDIWKNSSVRQLNFHQKLGIGAKILSEDGKNKESTLNHEIISKALTYENLEDKLNLLYVAMTRAKNNLYLVGSVKQMDKYKTFNFNAIVKARSMYDLMLPIIQNDDEAKNLFEVIVENPGTDKDTYRQPKEISIVDSLHDLDFKERISIQYPRKLSATDFVQINSLEKALARDLLRNRLKIKPDFLQKGKISSVEKGIIFHLVMELLDFSKDYDEDSLKSSLEELARKGVLSETEISSLDLDGLLGFFDSDIYKRIRMSKNYEKEKPFNLLIKPSMISIDNEGDNKIMVQGIMDLYFLEEDGYVLIDYKTDFVDKEIIKTKLQEYKKQLLLYKMALEDIRQSAVKEAYIYFSKIKEFIKIDFGG